jgi:outer membrane receptor protein involved in Fe transport
MQFVNTGPTNSGGLFAEAIDLGVNWAKDLADWSLAGRFNLSLAYTHALDGYIIPLPGADKDMFVGEVGGSEDRFNLALGYAIADFSITWRTTFIGPADLDDQFLKSNGFDENIGVDSVTYHDVQVSYSPGDKMEFYVGATNVFDESPPPIISGLPGDVTGAETDSGTYDAIGARYYGGVRVKF